MSAIYGCYNIANPDLFDQLKQKHNIRGKLQKELIRAILKMGISSHRSDQFTFLNKDFLYLVVALFSGFYQNKC